MTAAVFNGLLQRLSWPKGMLWSYVEKRYVFFPRPGSDSTPGDAGLEYEDVFLTTDDGLRLHGWFVPGPEGGGQTWLWCHGNGGNLSNRVDEIALLHRRIGVNLFIFDYRGFGRSTGAPSEWGTYVDARAALQYLRGRPGVDPERLVYFGHSLGASIAVELAMGTSPLGLVLVSPFTSIREMADLTPMFRPFSWLVRGRYDSLARLPSIKHPILVLHGDLDTLVPIAQGRKVFYAANEPKRFVTLRGAAHNDTCIVTQEELVEALAQFKAEVS